MSEKRKAPTFAQNITCAFCGKTAKKRQNGQKFCTEECRLANVRVKNIERRCEVCNETYFVRRKSSPIRTCGKFCGDVLNSVEQQTYSDQEIIHLVLLNAGYGITRFESKVTGLGSNHRDGGRLFWIRNQHLEETGIDLFKILSDSTKLIEMKRDEWMANGRPPKVKDSGTYGHHAGRIKQSTLLKRLEIAKARGGKQDPKNPRTHLKCLVYPEFNWGPYEDRQ